MHKFYKEHLHPLPPGMRKPNIRHVVTWALRSGAYSLSWNFVFDKQVNWSAAEAAWQLMTECESATWNQVRPAMFNDGKSQLERHDGAWADDGYTDDDFHRLAVQAAEMREDENDARAEATMDADNESESEDGDGVVHSQQAGDAMARLTAYFNAIEPAANEDQDQSDAASDDTRASLTLPVYAAAAAEEMANRARTPSADSDISATASELAREAARGRNRYVDDEAIESDG